MCCGNALASDTAGLRETSDIATLQVFAYGQTGSGKTFAMGTMGRQLSTSGESDGIISRSMRFVFDRMKDIRQQYDVSLKVLLADPLHIEVTSLNAADEAGQVVKLACNEK